MIRNLKKMMDDEEAMGTILGLLLTCLGEINFCVNPISWICCAPCLLGPALGCLVTTIYGIMDFLVWPLECCGIGTIGSLLGGTLGLLCCMPCWLPPFTCCVTGLTLPPYVPHYLL